MHDTKHRGCRARSWAFERTALSACPVVGWQALRACDIGRTWTLPAVHFANSTPAQGSSHTRPPLYPHLLPHLLSLLKASTASRRLSYSLLDMTVSQHARARQCSITCA